MTITEFLTARLDEDESVARRAMHSNGYWTHEFEFGQETRVRLDFGPDVAHGRGTLEASNHAHIALHDPARVLADITAKRAIVAEYEAAEAYYRAHADAPAGELTGLKSAVCHLASVYASHKDYGRAR